MKARKIKIEEMDIVTLKDRLGVVETTYNTSEIQFRNSKGETKVCPANLIDRLGNYAGPAEDKAARGQFMDVYFKAEAEARRGVVNGAEAKLVCGTNAKAGTVRVASTVKGIEGRKARVSEQVAICQKMAREIHAIRIELERRAAIERAATEAAAAAKVEADTREYLGMPKVAVAA